jgi:hypothetical protein
MIAKLTLSHFSILVTIHAIRDKLRRSVVLDFG